MNLQTKAMIIASMGLIGMIVGSIAYGDSIELAKVDLYGFGQWQDDIATYGLNKCREEVGDIEGTYNCENFVLTLNSENGSRSPTKTSPKNGNGTRDYGYCQLNDKYHSKFIHSSGFADPYTQMDYCIGVWKDAQKKGTMPRYGFKSRYKRDKGIKFIYPELSKKISEPSLVAKDDEPKLKLTGRKCRLLYQTKTDKETIQVDSVWGTFIGWFKNMDKGTKVFTCKDK